MTAEVAVMNRNAVALAADSAVTLQLPEGPKIYQTNKLFALSKYQPIGIMIFGNAEFMGLPWETIIKQYRSRLGRDSFGTLEEYGDGFLQYIEKDSGFRSRKLQEEYCRFFVHSWLRRFKNGLRIPLKKIAESGTPIDDRIVKSTCRAWLKIHNDALKNRPRLPRFRGISPSAVVSRYRSAIRQATAAELQKLPRFVSARKLELTIGLALTRDAHWSQESGIVIAGFGRKQVLPSLRCYVLDGMIMQRLRVSIRQNHESDIRNDNAALVTAFAQSEMASLFMNGIDTDFQQFLLGFIGKSFSDGYPAAVQRLLEKRVPTKQLNRITQQLRDIGEKLNSELASAVREYSRLQHWEPIIEIVRHLPKEELAAMAEALVNLTSFKRHVTRQAETVGGPIDVAVISRGDGLIWIKRKHYFKTDLNQHFLANYYNDCKEAQVPYAKRTRFLSK